MRCTLAMKRFSLPIAEPCEADWEAMSPTEAGKFCQQCVKQVYDVSAMTRRAAEAFLADKAGSRICVRYRCDSAGNIRFAPERPVAAAAAATGVVLAMALAACTPHENPRVEQDQQLDRIEEVEEPWEVMGGVEAVPHEPEPVDEITVKGEVPIEEPQGGFMGALRGPEPEPEPEEVEPCDKTQPLMGDIIAPEPEPEFVRMGKPSLKPPPEPETKGNAVVPEPEVRKPT